LTNTAIHDLYYGIFVKLLVSDDSDETPKVLIEFASLVMSALRVDENHPAVRDVLHRLSMLRLSPDGVPPFASDEEYFAHVEAIFITRLQLQDAQESAPFQMAILGAAKRRSEEEISSLNELIKKLNQSLVSLETSLEERLQMHNDRKLECVESLPRLPRLVRLLPKLKVSKAEELAIQYVVLHNVGTHFPPPDSRSERRGMLRNMASLCGLTSKQVLDFIGPSRIHIQDGLFGLDESFSSEFSGVFFKMSKEVLSALLGGTLTPDEFLSIEQTQLGQVLAEEGFAPFALPCPDVPAQVDKGDGEGSEADESDPDAVYKSDADLAMEGGEEQEIAGPRAAAVVEKLSVSRENVVTPATVESGNNNTNLLPYSDDLEYLADCFQVVCCRVKGWSLNAQQDSNAITSFDKKKSPEMLLREEKVKRRGFSSAYFLNMPQTRRVLSV
jgi:hypothetical protein